jgi:hypothetical protein
LMWKPEIFVEVIQATFNKNKDKTIHDKVVSQLKQIDSIRTGIKESELQQTISIPDKE